MAINVSLGCKLWTLLCSSTVDLRSMTWSEGKYTPPLYKKTLYKKWDPGSGFWGTSNLRKAPDPQSENSQNVRFAQQWKKCTKKRAIQEILAEAPKINRIWLQAPAGSNLGCPGCLRWAWRAARRKFLACYWLACGIREESRVCFHKIEATRIRKKLQGSKKFKKGCFF